MLPVVEEPGRVGGACQRLDREGQLFAGNGACLAGVRFADSRGGDKAVPERRAELEEREEPAQFGFVPSTERSRGEVY